MVIIVFDFDDTLFATSHFYGNEPILCPELSVSINQVLELAEQIGKVYIITNAEKSWLELCLKRQIPDCKMLEKIIDKQDGVFSSIDNDVTEDFDVEVWKYNAFSKKFSEFDDGVQRELICFGDSPYDRQAALSIKEKYSNVIVKNVLTEYKPTLEHLINQHRIIISHLNIIVEHSGHLDLLLANDTLLMIPSMEKLCKDKS